MTAIDLTAPIVDPNRREPTDEQRAILAQPPNMTMVVEAGAGTGKTTTLVDYARAWPRHRGLYLAFNKDIASEARSRFPPNVTAQTGHAYAFKALGVAKHKDRLVGKIRRQTIRQAGIDIHTPYLTPDRMLRAIISAITNFSIDAGRELLPHHCGLERSPAVTQANVLPKIAEIVKRFINYETSGLPFTHDIYLKNLEMFGKLGDVADYILLDEAQDSNPVMLSLIAKSGKPAIVVGDPFQSIYGFRGAINALEKIEGPRFPLSQSWRFGPDVAHIANHILSYSSREQMKPLRGRDDRDTIVECYNGQAPAHSFILARTNSRLFEGLINCKAPFYVAGGFDTLASQLMSAWALSRNEQHNVTDSFVRGFATWDDLVDEAVEEDPDAKRLVKIVKEYGDQIPQIIERLRGLQRPHPQDAHILLSTAHRAKGLESDTVIVLDDFATPRELKARLLADDLGSVEYDQEINLLYTAVTRARYRLFLSSNLYDEFETHAGLSARPALVALGAKAA